MQASKEDCTRCIALLEGLTLAEHANESDRTQILEFLTKCRNRLPREETIARQKALRRERDLRKQSAAQPEQPPPA